MVRPFRRVALTESEIKDSSLVPMMLEGDAPGPFMAGASDLEGLAVSPDLDEGLGANVT